MQVVLFIQEVQVKDCGKEILWIRVVTTDVYHTVLFPGLRMQLQGGLISCAAVTRDKKPLPLLVEYIESR